MDDLDVAPHNEAADNLPWHQWVLRFCEVLGISDLSFDSI